MSEDRSEMAHFPFPLSTGQVAVLILPTADSLTAEDAERLVAFIKTLPPADEAKHYCAKCERIVDGETALIHQTCGTWVESAADYAPPADETKR